MLTALFGSLSDLAKSSTSVSQYFGDLATTTATLIVAGKHGFALNLRLPGQPEFRYSLIRFDDYRLGATERHYLKLHYSLQNYL